MKRLTLLAVAGALLLAGCSTNEISNGDITLRFNNKMQSRVVSNNETTDSFHSDFISADALVAEEVTIDTWSLKKSTKHTTEKGEAITLKGEYKKNGFAVEKIQTIIAPEGFENMLLIETKYVNTGEKSLRLKSAEQNRTIVDKSEAKRS